MISNKKYFVGYQVSNLAFQIFLIPFLYSNFELADIGEIVLLSAISQIVINFVSSGASILGVSRVEGITTSEIFSIQLLTSLVSAFLFFISGLFWVEDNLLNGIFSVYIISSGISLYWNYVYNEQYKKLFLANLVSKLFFFLFIMFSEHTQFNYAVSIVLEFLLFNVLLVLCERDKLKVAMFRKLILVNYIRSSASRMLSYFSLQFDKIVVGGVFGEEVLAIYNLVYKLVEVPANLLIQFNHIFMSRIREGNVLPKIYAVSSSIVFSLCLFLSEYISKFITNNKIDVLSYREELLFLCVLVSSRVYFEYLSFKNYYSHGKYVYPSVIQFLTVFPYGLLFIYELNLGYFCLMVSVCSVTAFLVLEVKSLKAFNWQFLLLLVFTYVTTVMVFNLLGAFSTVQYLYFVAIVVFFLRYVIGAIRNA